ncbi:hypothetical protein WJX84_005426 [Apatococcus fuscideae]|uniref:Uncharacterized protein n=2 Tax=Apatococcus fuscideae TaxID=2026836 RepID=A0AAW1SQT6_9CHLO
MAACGPHGSALLVCIELFAVLSCTTLIIVVPTNVKGDAIKRGLASSGGDDDFTDLDTVTMTNVARQSNLLWIHAVVAWLASGPLVQMLWRYTKLAVKLRIEYMMHTKKGAETHSVLVRDIPGVQGATSNKTSGGGAGARIGRGLGKGLDSVVSAGQGMLSSTQSMVRRRRRFQRMDEGAGNAAGESPSSQRDLAAELEEFEQGATELDAQVPSRKMLMDGYSVQEIVEDEYAQVHPGSLKRVHLMYNTAKLEPLVKEYKQLQQSLEDIVDDIKFRKRHGKPVKPKQVRVIGVRYGSWGMQKYGKKPVKVDQLDFWPARLTQLRQEITAEQPRVQDMPLPNAFITFKHRREQVVASMAMQHPDQRHWKVSAAPAPSDLVWGNIRLKGWQRHLRFILWWTLFVLLALFYTVPVGAIQAILQVNRLQNITPFKQLVNISFTRSLIQSILPVLVLKIFLALVPKLLAFMNTKQGMISQSGNDFGVVKKYFIFQVITVFFASFVSGSFFNQFSQWISDPASAVTIIGSAAPTTSIFFLTLIILQALLLRPIQFLRIFQLIMYWLLSMLSGTERAKTRIWSEQSLLYGPYVPDHTIVILLGIVFCCVNPLLCVAAFVYFCIVWLLEKYDMLYVWQETYQAGGKLWLQIFPQVLTGVLIFHIMMIGLLAIKESYATIILIPLPFIAIAFWLVCNRLFSRPLQILSLKGAADLDRKDEVQQQLRQQRPSDLEAQQDPQAAAASEQGYIDPALIFDETQHQQLLDNAKDIKLVLQGSKVLEPEQDRQSNPDDPWAHVSDQPGSLASADALSAQEPDSSRA